MESVAYFHEDSQSTLPLFLYGLIIPVFGIYAPAQVGQESKDKIYVELG